MEIRTIKGFPDYRIDRKGTIFNKNMKKLKFFQRSKKQRDVKGGDHYFIKLRKDGKRYTKSVHALVLETFGGRKPKRAIARHKNDLATDNRLENLKWGTYKQNVRDCRKNYKMYKSFYIFAQSKFPKILKEFNSRTGFTTF
jgi:hypothetical protein